MAHDYTFSEDVALIAVEKGTNSIGEITQEETKRYRYAEIISPHMKESYEAMAKGYRVEFVVVLPNWYDDYHGEEILEYKGDRYNVIRAYKAKDLTCELTVTKIKANVSDSGTLASIYWSVNNGDPI